MSISQAPWSPVILLPLCQPGIWTPLASLGAPGHHCSFSGVLPMPVELPGIRQLQTSNPGLFWRVPLLCFTASPLLSLPSGKGPQSLEGPLGLWVQNQEGKHALVSFGFLPYDLNIPEGSQI